MFTHPSVTARNVRGRGRRRAPLFLLTALLAAGSCGRSDEGGLSSVEQSLSIAFVQLNYATPQSSVATVSVPFTAAQSAGNLNVVVVGWNDTTSQVSSVSDSKGNVYQLAVGPSAVSGAVTQSIYYAKNIVTAAAGANTVEVSFTAAALYPDIRILEYAGMDQLSPVDVTASAAGTTATSRTLPVATTTSPGLLFAANTVATWTMGAGSGELIVSTINKRGCATAVGQLDPVAQLLAGLAAGCANFGGTEPALASGFTLPVLSINPQA